MRIASPIKKVGVRNQYRREASDERIFDKKKDAILWAGPVLVSDKLIVVSSNGYAQALSPDDGKLVGRVEIPGGTTIAPVVADGTMYIYTASAELVALR